jgi:hypothetical protein
MRLCENEVESIVCFLPARVTPFLHDFAFRLEFVILRDLLADMRIKLKLIWFWTGIFYVFENCNKI